MTKANETDIQPKAMAHDVPVYCSHDKIVPTEALIKNPRNPNTHPQNQIEALAKIIKNQGWRSPITVSTRSGFIVKGHGRLEAAIFAGLNEVPVDYQNYENEAAEWADLVADNRIAELSTIDDNLLSDLLSELQETDFDLELTGFSEDELDLLLTSNEHHDIDSFFETTDETDETSNEDSQKDDFIKCPNCGTMFTK